MYNKVIFKRCFHYRGKQWYKNIKNIPLYFYHTHFLMKHGYYEYALWETFDCFIETTREILTFYRYKRTGSPVLMKLPEPLTEEYKKAEKQNELLADQLFDRMLSLLNEMDEDNPKYERMDYAEKTKCMNEAKDAFFELFSKYFYYLWD